MTMTTRRRKAIQQLITMVTPPIRPRLMALYLGILRY